MTDKQIFDWMDKNMPHFRRIDECKVEMVFVSNYAFEIVIGDNVRDCVVIVLLDDQDETK